MVLAIGIIALIGLAALYSFQKIEQELDDDDDPTGCLEGPCEDWPEFHSKHEI